jgi:hypothetical protein
LVRSINNSHPNSNAMRRYDPYVVVEVREKNGSDMAITQHKV